MRGQNEWLACRRRQRPPGASPSAFYNVAAAAPQMHEQGFIRVEAGRFVDDRCREFLPHGVRRVMLARDAAATCIGHALDSSRRRTRSRRYRHARRPATHGWLQHSMLHATFLLTSAVPAGWNGWMLTTNAVSNPASITAKFKLAQVDRSTLIGSPAVTCRRQHPRQQAMLGSCRRCRTVSPALPWPLRPVDCKGSAHMTCSFPE